MTQTVVKLFNDPAVAVIAIRELQSRGFKASDIGIAVRSGNVSDMIVRRAEVVLSGKAEAAGGVLALSGPAANGSSLDSLGDIWGVPKDALFYYESGLQRGGVVVSVHVDESKASEARAILRQSDTSRIVLTDPPTNDRPFYLSARASKFDDRDRLFSGDFRKY